MLPWFNLISVTVTQNFQVVKTQKIETSLVYMFSAQNKLLMLQLFILEWLFC